MLNVKRNNVRLGLTFSYDLYALSYKTAKLLFSLRKRKIE